MRQNYSAQTTNYGGLLTYGPTVSFATTVSIPLNISSIDIPLRKPKLTEIGVIPTHDEANVSDWSANVLFYGGQGLLTTTMAGFFLTPVILVADAISHIKYQVHNPVADNSLQGYSYGDVIWAYLQGKMNQPAPNIFIRTDPTTFTDPYGNVYNNPIIQQFQCDFTPTTEKQTFSMTLYLEV